jgi:hypothetical protein
MKNAAFDEFVKSQQADAHSDVNWNAIRDEWLRRLDELYGQIRTFLNDYVNAGEIHLELSPITLNEENIGIYTAPQLTLMIGRKQVRFQPIGTLLIGSRGRVDVIGTGVAEARLVLINKNFTRASDMIRITIDFAGKLPTPPKKDPSNIDQAWKIVTRPPERRFIELTQETLFRMIMEVANG